MVLALLVVARESCQPTVYVYILIAEVDYKYEVALALILNIPSKPPVTVEFV